MPGPFSITAATESVRLDPQGRGTVTFTVSNVSGRARRGRARLVPGNPTQAAWATLEGEAERDFGVDATHQLTVRVAAPPGTPAGRITFGLDAVSVENPDEEFTQGPKVAFEVPATEGKKPFPWWIVAVIVAVLLLGGVVAFLVGRRTPDPVPEKVPEKVALQGTCPKPDACAAGLTCLAATPGQPGVCLGSVGFAACRRDADCSTGLACQAGTCKGGLSFAGCKAEADCATGLTCAGGNCVGKTGFAGCKAPADCATQLCINGTCLDQTILAACESDASCAPGESCVKVSADQVCLRQTGQPCTKSLECVSRACNPDSKVCEASDQTCLVPADCRSPGQCINGNCLLPVGAPCTDNLKCTTGLCSAGACANAPVLCGTGGVCPALTVCQQGVCKPQRLIFEKVQPVFVLPTDVSRFRQPGN